MDEKYYDGNDSNNYKQPNTKKNNPLITILLIIIVIGVGYLCFANYQEKHSSALLDSSHKVLVLSLTDESDSVSDSVQVKNALSNGGQIVIDNSSSDAITKSIGSDIWMNYEARGKDMYFYLNGALFNYVASQGWQLVQGPSTGISKVYYFSR